MADTITVMIPTALRQHVDGQDTLEVDGTSVSEVLSTLTQRYPELGQRLFKAADELNRFVNVYVNDEDIRFLDNLATSLNAGDEVSIVPAIAGG